MKILVLQDDIFGYLQHIVKSYAAQGIDLNEGLGLHHIAQAFKAVQSVDETQVAKVQTGEVAGVPVAAVSVEDQKRHDALMEHMYGDN
jgi:hypothetical protein